MFNFMDTRAMDLVDPLQLECRRAGRIEQLRFQESPIGYYCCGGILYMTT